MARRTLELAERRSTMEAATRAAAGTGEALASASGAELAELMEVADSLTAAASAARASLTVEAVRRGEVTGSETHAWVRDWSTSSASGGRAPCGGCAPG